MLEITKIPSISPGLEHISNFSSFSTDSVLSVHNLFVDTISTYNIESTAPTPTPPPTISGFYLIPSPTVAAKGCSPPQELRKCRP